MNDVKSYRNSLLSALCAISWVVIVFRIFTGASDNDLINKFIWTWMITISTGIIGGIALHFYSILKKRTIKNSFVYNLFATSNVIAGFFGMTLPTGPGQPTPYVIAASLTVGVLMYINIYGRSKWIKFK
jgi:hypothetical protein